jgi:hypothetical protein
VAHFNLVFACGSKVLTILCFSFFALCEREKRETIRRFGLLARCVRQTVE